MKTLSKNLEVEPPDIGVALRRIRQQHGYSQLCLGYNLGISRNSYILWERNRVNVGIAQLSALCQFYDIKLSTFFADYMEQPSMHSVKKSA